VGPCVPAFGGCDDVLCAAGVPDIVPKSKLSVLGAAGIGGACSVNGMFGMLGRRLSRGIPSCDRSSLLGRLRLGSKGPLFSVFMRFMTFSPALLVGLLGSGKNGSIGFPPCREPAREEPRSLGELRPLLEPGRLPGGSPNGKAGKAQSKPADSSGLGGLGSHNRGIGPVVTLRCGGGGRPPKLLPDLELAAGEMGDSGRGRGARNGRFAASELICGGGARILEEGGAEFEPAVGALGLV